MAETRDGTQNEWGWAKSVLGANTILAVSGAIGRAGAASIARCAPSSAPWLAAATQRRGVAALCSDEGSTSCGDGAEPSREPSSSDDDGAAMAANRSAGQPAPAAGAQARDLVEQEALAQVPQPGGDACRGRAARSSSRSLPSQLLAPGPTGR